LRTTDIEDMYWFLKADATSKNLGSTDSMSLCSNKLGKKENNVLTHFFVINILNFLPCKSLQEREPWMEWMFITDKNLSSQTHAHFSRSTCIFFFKSQDSVKFTAMKEWPYLLRSTVYVHLKQIFINGILQGKCYC